MAINRAFVIVALCSALGGCVTGPTFVWHKDGATRQQFAEDRYTCLQRSTVEAPAAIGSSAYCGNGVCNADSYDHNVRQRDVLFGACMEASGWRKQPIKPQSS